MEEEEAEELAEGSAETLFLVVGLLDNGSDCEEGLLGSMDGTEIFEVAGDILGPSLEGISVVARKVGLDEGLQEGRLLGIKVLWVDGDDNIS